MTVIDLCFCTYGLASNPPPLGSGLGLTYTGADFLAAARAPTMFCVRCCIAESCLSMLPVPDGLVTTEGALRDLDGLLTEYFDTAGALRSRLILLMLRSFGVCADAEDAMAAAAISTAIRFMETPFFWLILPLVSAILQPLSFRSCAVAQTSC